MKLTLTVHLDNADFWADDDGRGDDFNRPRLQQLVDSAMARMAVGNDSGIILDGNGNSVGGWVIGS